MKSPQTESVTTADVALSEHDVLELLAFQQKVGWKGNWDYVFTRWPPLLENNLLPGHDERRLRRLLSDGKNAMRDWWAAHGCEGYELVRLHVQARLSADEPCLWAIRFAHDFVFEYETEDIARGTAAFTTWRVEVVLHREDPTGPWIEV